MDVAIKLDVHDTAAISLVTEPKTQAPVFTKHILRVNAPEVVPDHDYIQENIYFTSARLNEALVQIKNGEVQMDCILITIDAVSPSLLDLKEQAKQRFIPFILYTAKFDQTIKDLAIKIGADEYHYGAITYAFLKRIEFIKKLKAYKNQRGNKPYVFHKTFEEVPKIKLWALKRTFDIILSLAGILFLSPLLIVIAILIRLESRGPIIYTSKRAGAGYKIFDFYKFRSMRTGADAQLAALAHLNQYSGANEQNGVFFKFKNDPRVTRVGEFLRNTSLDEIPQLFNVLKGDMSLVGNRPLPLYEAEKLTKDQIAWRFLAPAGITGLWQVRKRGKDNMSEEERIQLDMEYAMKNSFIYDIKILFETFPALIQKQNV